jgi:hypothetical protein
MKNLFIRIMDRITPIKILWRIAFVAFMPGYFLLTMLGVAGTFLAYMVIAPFLLIFLGAVWVLTGKTPDYIPTSGGSYYALLDEWMAFLWSKTGTNYE